MYYLFIPKISYSKCSIIYSSPISSNLLREHRRLHAHLVKPAVKISPTWCLSIVCHLVSNFITWYSWTSGSQLLPESSPNPHRWPKMTSKNTTLVTFSHGIPTAQDLCSSLSITDIQSDKIIVSGQYRYHNLTFISHTHSHQNPQIFSNQSHWINHLKSQLFITNIIHDSDFTVNYTTNSLNN